jgi:hypothetical protein
MARIGGTFSSRTPFSPPTRTLWFTRSSGWCSGSTLGAPASADEADQGGDDEQHDPDDGEPEQALDREAEDGEDCPDDQKDNHECQHRSSVLRGLLAWLVLGCFR